MIPKKIHFCWLSNDPFPEKIQKCLDSWMKYLPDYEFVHWDKQKLDTLNSKWANEAFDNKKYAFAADFIRCYSVYNEGGIYLDTDVEVCKSFDPMLKHHSFMGLDSNGDLEAAVFGAEPHAEWLKKALDFYKDRNFVNIDGTFNIVTMPNVFKSVLSDILPDNVSSITKEKTFSKFTLYPKDYFSPKDYTTGIIKRTKNTVCIHHFTAAWLSDNTWAWRRHKLKLLVAKLFGQRFATQLSRLIRR